MRVFIAAFVTAIALLVTGCSGGTEGSTLQRGRSASATRAPEASGATGSGSGASNAAGSTSSSAPAPAPPAADTAPATSDAGASGTAPAPAPAAALGSCGNPKCLGGNGLAGCKATDSAGDIVTMGCQDGACACFAGGQTTATFDGDVNSADDAAQLFLANCPCN